MNQLFSRVLVILLAALFVAACSSKEKEELKPEVGTVQGQITPANAITLVTAIDAGNQTITATPTATGAYTLLLGPGNHTLRFTPAAGFTAPADQLISVSAGGTTYPDPTHVTQSGGTATLTINGAAVAVSLVRAELAFGDLTLTVLSTSGQTVRLTVSPYDGTARTGSFAGFSNARLRYTESAGGAEWATPTTGTPTGSYSLTPAGTNPVRISGAFSGTGQPSNSAATGTKTIAGTFTNVAY